MKRQTQLPIKLNTQESVNTPTPKMKREMPKIWKNRGLVIITYVKKFIEQIKEHSTKNKFHHLPQSIFNLIDDPASNYTYYQ